MRPGALSWQARSPGGHGIPMRKPKMRTAIHLGVRERVPSLLGKVLRVDLGSAWSWLTVRDVKVAASASDRLSLWTALRRSAVAKYTGPLTKVNGRAAGTFARSC